MTMQTRAQHPLLQQLQPRPPQASLASGHAALDAALHTGGWPLGALTELLLALPGAAEITLLAPALRTALQQPGALVLVNPPGLPHAPAWNAAGLGVERLLIVRPSNPRDWLWSVDQAARAGMPAVVAWPGRIALNGKHLRRLQLAAELGGGLLVLSRRPLQQEEASPAALRLRIQNLPGALDIEVIKQRGHWGGQRLQLSLPHPLEPAPPAEHWLNAAADTVPARKTTLRQVS